MTDHDAIQPARTLSIQVTQQCTAACQHCGTFSGPKTKLRLPESLAEEAIHQAAADGYRDVSFSGGEPTLSGKWLFRAIELAKSLGLGTRLVTNGWWAKSPALGRQMAQRLVAAGLDEITLSTGDQHARFVSVDTVVGGICAAVREGLCVAVVVELVEPRCVTKSALMERLEIQELRQSTPGARLNFYESPWMPLSPSELESYPDGVAVNASNLARRGGCEDILRTITISPDGTVGACCGIGMRRVPDLQLGNIANTSIVQATRRAERDPLKRWIRAEGPERILAWAASHQPAIQWENRYAHRCQACIRMYTDPEVQAVLREKRSEFFIEA